MFSERFSTSLPAWMIAHAHGCRIDSASIGSVMTATAYRAAPSVAMSCGCNVTVVVSMASYSIAASVSRAKRARA